MRVLAHVSDLHFGAHEAALVDSLHHALLAIGPDLVVVSGDLTQRARPAQFAAAAAFLRGLEAAGLRLLVVPGNHDVPLHRPVTRLLWPLRRYRRAIGRERPSFVADETVAVLGLSSAHGLTVSDGRLTRAQVRGIAPAFAAAPAGATRVLVTHHPLLPFTRPSGEVEPALRGAGRTLAAVRAADVAVVLTGHHHAHAVTAAAAKPALDPHVLVVQAGTATSWRRRGTPNSFNVLEIEPGQVRVAEWTADAARWQVADVSTFGRACPGGGWRRGAPAPAPSGTTPSRS